MVKGAATAAAVSMLALPNTSVSLFYVKHVLKLGPPERAGVCTERHWGGVSANVDDSVGKRPAKQKKLAMRRNKGAKQKESSPGEREAPEGLGIRPGNPTLSSPLSPKFPHPSAHLPVPYWPL